MTNLSLRDTWAALVTETVAALRAASPGREWQRANSALEAAITAIDQAGMAPRRDAFVETYGIEVISGHEVKVNLGEVSRIAFLREAQALACGLRGKDAVWPATLERWANKPAFQSSPRKEIAVDGNVKNSTVFTRQEQEVKGWCNVSLEDMAVAHAAYLIATGNDLFGGYTVRLRDGVALEFVSGKLCEGWDDPDRSRPNIAASEALSSRQRRTG